MERKNYKGLMPILLFTFFICFQNISANNYACFFYETYAKGDISGWENEFRKLEKENPQNFSVLSDALIARYGFVGYLIGIKENGKARILLDETEKILEKLLRQNPGNARLLGVKAGLTGLRIGLSPMRAPFLGQRNADAYEEAIKNNPKEPMGWIEKGNSLFHRPAMFGGDKKEAEASFLKALEISEPKGCSWLHSFIQVRLYEAYKANGKASEAERIRQALQSKPGYFKWIEAL